MTCSAGDKAGGRWGRLGQAAVQGGALGAHARSQNAFVGPAGRAGRAQARRSRPQP